MSLTQDELLAAAIAGTPDAPKAAAPKASGVAVAPQLDARQIAEAWRTLQEADRIIKKVLAECDVAARSLVRKHPRLLPVLFPKGEGNHGT